MQAHYVNPGTSAAAESMLDELFGTLWAISVITRRMAGQINALRQKKGEPKHEQNVRTVSRRYGASQMW